MVLDLSIEDFVRLRNLIYEKTGIHFGENKVYFVKKRLQKRMELNQIDSVNEYIKFLKYFDLENREFQELINTLTVNETYFFREYPQLQVFAEGCLEDVIQRKLEVGDRNLRVFSAGCSTGEEPYTLAIILREMLEDYGQWNVQVKGVDIDEIVLASARKGVYDSRSVKDVPPGYLKKYFTTKAGEYHINNDIRQMVVFDHANLMDRRALRNESHYDFVFCRNVLIYFDDLSRKQVVDKFYAMLNKGGYIFLGHAESLGRISTAFKIKRMNDFIVYQT